MTSFTFDEKRLEYNLDLLARTDALTAQKLQLASFDEIQFCLTEQDELNLYKERYGITDYYHSQEGALKEAKELLSDEVLKKNQVIYFYGLGLAYIYDALKNWLKEDPNHHLVLFEHDLEVVYCFLSTERATSILQDSQVTLFCFPPQVDRLKLFQLNSCFINQSIYFFALPYYAQRYQRESLNLCYLALYDHSLVGAVHNEYLSGQKNFLANFYPNLFHLPDCYMASGLYGKFNNIPAIICGAGPSIEKNIELLKTLKDRALIFAGGSSLNVLNSYGMLPHFGLGIDPNPEQYHRLLTNHTFHIPFFYRPRLSQEAFRMIQGPKLYVSGNLHKFPLWFDQQLGLDAPEIDEGHNVVHFCTEIARLMGCNPIIYVGMDLAFTEIKTYAPGIPTHPLWLGFSHPYSPDKDQQAVNVKGFNGEPLKTKWEWILESEWLGRYSKFEPSLHMINATEGGLGFPSVPNKTLAEVANEYLTKSYDLQDWVHTEIQNSRLKVTGPQILTLVVEFKRSLEKCLDYCNKLLEIKLEGSDAPHQLTKEALYETLLQEEIGYEYFLDLFEKSHLYKERANTLANRDSTANPVHRYRFLEAVLKQHMDLITQTVRNYIFLIPLMDETIQIPSPPIAEGEQYQFTDNQIIIHDPELSLNVEEKFAPSQEDIWSVHYPNGSLKMEMMYQNGQLHGPSRFYSDKGILLAESWFLHGQRQGKNRQFYPSGKLYAIQRYKDNQMHGLQEYFYENGALHVILSYQNGRLNGDVLIYRMNGEIIRELHYQEGQRNGLERMWHLSGSLALESFYQMGIPIGSAHQFNPKGHVVKEVNIHDYPADFDLSVATPEGKLIPQVTRGIQDYSAYYEETRQRAELIEGSIQILMRHLETLFSNYSKNATEADPKINQEIEELKKEVEKLQAQKEELLQIMKENLENAEAARQKLQSSE